MKAERYVDAGFVQIAIVDVDTLVRNWWVVLLRGLAGIIFGLVTFLAPDISQFWFSSSVRTLLSTASSQSLARSGGAPRWTAGGCFSLRDSQESPPES